MGINTAHTSAPRAKHKNAKKKGSMTKSHVPKIVKPSGFRADTANSASQQAAA
jgi:hypothetical protein